MAELLEFQLPTWFIRIVAFAFGAAWGSFFNVVVYRLPRGISVVAPKSYCPACGRPVPVHLNIPIVSYFVLGGKTACCGSRLSPRYLVIEIISAFSCVAVLELFLIQAPASIGVLDAAMISLCYFIFVGGLVIVSFVDLEFMEIPDEVSLPVAALGLATAAFRAPDAVVSMALGAGGGYLLIQLVFVWTYERLTGRRGMGEGDAKLMLMIGAFIGWKGALFSLLAGSCQGLLAVMIAALAGKGITRGRSIGRGDRATGHAVPTDIGTNEQKDPGIRTEQKALDFGQASDREETDDFDEPEPRYFGHLKVYFGPFLALSAVEYLFFGERVIEAYFTIY